MVRSSLLTASFFAVFFLCLAQVECSSNGHHFDTSSLSLEERIELQKSTVHWYPYKRILYHVQEDGALRQDCPERESSVEQFPEFFTRTQRLQGFIAIHFFVAIYLFIFLAFICDKYFLPTVERICEVLKISPDVAASTFMATATTMPEFFNNTISVFVAKSDMGLGAVIGSMLFNTLGVAASAAMFTKKPIQIDWWPITRDSILFSINITILTALVWDGVVMWYETIILVCLYVGYWVLMFQNVRIKTFVKHIIEDKFMWCQRIKNYDIVNQRPFEQPTPAVVNTVVDGVTIRNKTTNGEFYNDIRNSYTGKVNSAFESDSPGESPRTSSIIDQFKARQRAQSFDINGFDAAPKRDRRMSFDLTRIDEIDEEEFKVWEIPKEASMFDLFWYFFTWPIRFILHYTIPDPIRYKKWFAASFVLCIVWIGACAYLIFWMVVIIGDTFGIPEAVMGFTLLAFGGCMPEAISAVIVARKGSGQMGVSNALGANSLAVLFSLGLPWFIRTMASGAGFTGAYIHIASYGIEFTILALLLAVAALYLTIAIAGYKLRKIVGGCLGLFYIAFATVAVLVELNIIFDFSENC